LAIPRRPAGQDVDHIKRVTDEFGRQAQTFDLWAEKTDDQVADRFRTALAKAAHGNGLDVACGPGVVTAAIARGAAAVVAFDATEQMLEKARARCAKAGLRNVEFRHGDAESLPFEEAQFDGVVTRLVKGDEAPWPLAREVFPGNEAVTPMAGL